MVATSPNDAGMMQALASSPFNNNDSRGATPAGLAGASQSATGKATAESESPVIHELKQLRSAKSASDRENAAKTLAVSQAHALPEVVKAIEEAAKLDPNDSVRVCCVRCLYRISSDEPSVIPVIKRLQADPNEQVSKTARKAMEEIGKRDSSQPSR
jgi:HEAT repeat protein